MRILHTADWHLGAELKHVRRLPDQLARIEEVLTICETRKIDLLVVAGDFIDVTRAEPMTLILHRVGELLRLQLERGMTVVILAGNHDREWIFPFLQAARALFVEDQASRLHFASRPELKVIESAAGEKARLMLLPYPRQTPYGLEAITFKDAADRHSQMAAAVKQRISAFEAEIKKSAKMPTIVVGHLLIAGQKENGHELTEEADVPIPRVYLPNYAYVALGHVHLPTLIGSATCRYSGSIERMDFGERDEAKQVVLFELDSAGLVGEPEVVELHPAELRELVWSDGDDLVTIAREVPPDTICKLKLNVPVGTDVHALQAQAHNLIRRLCWPPEIHWEGREDIDVRTGSLALDRADWRGTVRAYVRERVPETDPLFPDIASAVEELLNEEVRA